MAAPQDDEEVAEEAEVVAGDATMEVAATTTPPKLVADEIEMLKILGLSMLKSRDKTKAIFPKVPALVFKNTPDEEVTALCKTSDLLASAQAQVVWTQRQIVACTREIELLGEVDSAAKRGQEVTLVFFK